MSTRPFTYFAGAALLLALGACASPEQKTAAQAMTGNTQFAADWSEHSKPLFNQGPGINPGTTSWRVPSILPRGYYRVIQRVNGKPVIVDGYRFEIDSNVMKEIHLMLPVTYTSVEALDEKYIVDGKGLAQ
ncbi:MAG: hypothetical protein V4634_00835 [Pseudomonadota bacterium]